MSEDKTSENEVSKSKTSGAMKNVVVLLVSPTLTFAAAYLAVSVNRNVEAEKINLAKVEALTKFKVDLTSDSQIDREYAYEALSALGFQKLADKMRIQSLNPDRIRVYVKNEQQKEARYPVAVADALSVPRSAIYVASKATKFPDSVEVRYFNAKDWTAAHRVATLIGHSAIVQPSPLKTSTRSEMEVWLPPEPPLVDAIYELFYMNEAPAGLFASIFCK